MCHNGSTCSFLTIPFTSTILTSLVLTRTKKGCWTRSKKSSNTSGLTALRFCLFAAICGSFKEKVCGPRIPRMEKQDCCGSLWACQGCLTDPGLCQGCPEPGLLIDGHMMQKMLWPCAQVSVPTRSFLYFYIYVSFFFSGFLRFLEGRRDVLLATSPRSPCPKIRRLYPTLLENKESPTKHVRTP